MNPPSVPCLINSNNFYFYLKHLRCLSCLRVHVIDEIWNILHRIKKHTCVIDVGLDFTNLLWKNYVDFGSDIMEMQINNRLSHGWFYKEQEIKITHALEKWQWRSYVVKIETRTPWKNLELGYHVKKCVGTRKQWLWNYFSWSQKERIHGYLKKNEVLIKESKYLEIKEIYLQKQRI